MAADHDVAPDGHAAEQGEVLEGAADAERRHAMPRLLQKLGTVEGDAAGFRLIEAAQAIEQRRLAGTVRTDQAANLPATHLERHIVQRHDAAEADRQTANRQQRRAIQIRVGHAASLFPYSSRYISLLFIVSLPRRKPGSIRPPVRL